MLLGVHDSYGSGTIFWDCGCIVSEVRHIHCSGQRWCEYSSDAIRGIWSNLMKDNTIERSNIQIDRLARCGHFCSWLRARRKSRSRILIHKCVRLSFVFPKSVRLLAWSALKRSILFECTRPFTGWGIHCFACYSQVKLPEVRDKMAS